MQLYFLPLAPTRGLPLTSDSCAERKRATTRDSIANHHRMFLQIVQIKSDDYLWQMPIDVGLCGLRSCGFCISVVLLIVCLLFSGGGMRRGLVGDAVVYVTIDLVQWVYGKKGS